MKTTTENTVLRFATTSPEDLAKLDQKVIIYRVAMAIVDNMGLSKQTFNKCSRAAAKHVGLSKNSIFLWLK